MRPRARDVPFHVIAELEAAPYLGLPAAAFVSGTIFTLARWVRESDERRARK